MRGREFQARLSIAGGGEGVSATGSSAAVHVHVPPRTQSVDLCPVWFEAWTFYPGCVGELG